MPNIQKIDLTEIKNTLLSGRKNGERAHKTMEVKLAEGYEIIARQEQLVTSSYFLGLIGDELVTLAAQLGTVDKVVSQINVDQLNAKSQDECIRAVRRSITSPRSLMD